MDKDVVLQLPVQQWEGPFTADIQAEALAGLEAGRVLVLGQLPFLLKEAEYRLLSTSASDNTRKNISFDPATGTAHGTALAGEEMALLVAMLDRFGREAESLVRNLFPRYAPKLERPYQLPPGGNRRPSRSAA
jgi:hypothetical protein